MDDELKVQTLVPRVFGKRKKKIKLVMLIWSHVHFTTKGKGKKVRIKGQKIMQWESRERGSLYLVFTALKLGCTAHKCNTSFVSVPLSAFHHALTVFQCTLESWCNSWKLIFQIEGHLFYIVLKWGCSKPLLLLLCRRIRYWLKKDDIRWCNWGESPCDGVPTKTL